MKERLLALLVLLLVSTPIALARDFGGGGNLGCTDQLIGEWDWAANQGGLSGAVDEFFRGSLANNSTVVLAGTEVSHGVLRPVEIERNDRFTLDCIQDANAFHSTDGDTSSICLSTIDAALAVENNACVTAAYVNEDAFVIPQGEWTAPSTMGRTRIGVQHADHVDNGGGGGSTLRILCTARQWRTVCQ